MLSAQSGVCVSSESTAASTANVATTVEATTKAVSTLGTTGQTT